MIEPLNVILMLLILICAFAIMIVPHHQTAVIIFGAFSLFSALFFALLGALDIAFTEAVVGATISTVFFVTALHVTKYGFFR